MGLDGPGPILKACYLLQCCGAKSHIGDVLVLILGIYLCELTLTPYEAFENREARLGWNPMSQSGNIMWRAGPGH